MVVSARTLLDDYNDWRNHTAHVFQLRQKGKYVRGYKLTLERERAFNNLITFCRRHEFDPRLWLYSLFKRRRWQFAPKFDQLISEKHIEHYQQIDGVDAYRRKLENELHTQQVAQGVTYDCNRDLSTTTEALKRRYLQNGEAARCKEETNIRTYGFHPRSLVCARCPLAMQCKQELQSVMPFDIMALRTGTLSAEQAREQARLRYGART